MENLPIPLWLKIIVAVAAIGVIFLLATWENVLRWLKERARSLFSGLVSKARKKLRYLLDALRAGRGRRLRSPV